MPALTAFHSQDNVSEGGTPCHILLVVSGVLAFFFLFFLCRQLAQLVVNTGALGGLVDYMGRSGKEAQLPAIQAIGYISSMSEELASAVIKSKVTLL